MEIALFFCPLAVQVEETAEVPLIDHIAEEALIYL
tara:strand:- start:478 stop:582 length:105 start_codon:yes stop_codon:yes gene_type:complete